MSRDDDRGIHAVMTEHVDYASLYDRLRAAGYHAADDQATHLSPHVHRIRGHLRYRSVLDIGCSSGGSLDLLGGEGREAVGVDVSHAAAARGQALGRQVIQACATRLPFRDRSFDLVVSADTLEHLHPDDVDAAVAEVKRVARSWLVLKIATREDRIGRWRDVAGHPLHLTIEPFKWWIDKFCDDAGALVWRRDNTMCVKVGLP